MRTSKEIELKQKGAEFELPNSAPLQLTILSVINRKKSIVRITN